MIGEPKIKDRKVIQISVSTYREVCIIALCDDGTMWTNESFVPIPGNASKWIQMTKIPADDSKLEKEGSQ